MKTFDKSNSREEADVEDGIATIYGALYRLRQAGQYQREYDIMGNLITMMMEDRRFIREKYKVEVI